MENAQKTLQHGPETRAYVDYFNDQKEKGLRDVKFAVLRGVASTEDAFAVINFCRNHAARQKAKLAFAPKPSRDR